MPWGIYGSYERDARINFREGPLDWKIKVRVQFLRVKRDHWATSPSPLPTCLLFPNRYDENFEINVLLKTFF
jgi:hypothetical protein